MVNNENELETEPLLIKRDLDGKILIYGFCNNNDNGFIPKYFTEKKFEGITFANNSKYGIKHDGHCSAFSFFKAKIIAKYNYDLVAAKNDLKAIQILESNNDAKKVSLRLLNVCNSIQAKISRFSNCFFTACVVAFNLEGE